MRYAPLQCTDLFRAAQDDTLTLTLDGWEGPLDLLLTLARAQKVDLHAISILALVEQYLAYLEQAKSLRLEIAADYLVMAAWLAYLKSCLLLPDDPTADPSPEDIALAPRSCGSQRLDAMREAGARLMGGDRIGRDVFVRGWPEGLRLVRTAAWQASAFDLYAAYGRVKARTQPAMHVVHDRAVMTLEDAIARVAALLGEAIDWTTLEAFLPVTSDPAYRRSALASSFVAALELARQGRLELAQDAPFDDLAAAGASHDRRVRPRASKRPCSPRPRRSPPTRSALMPARAMSPPRSPRWPQHLRRPRHRAGRARRALAFPDRARPRPHPPPHARGAAPPVARGDRDAGDHRLSRARQPRRDRGDPRRADLARARSTC